MHPLPERNGTISLLGHLQWLKIHANRCARNPCQIHQNYSPENVKLKPLPKKKQNRKSGKEWDLYHKNYLHACESLLSAVPDIKGSTASLSLKKFTQFSAGIARIGLAVLLSAASKMGVTFSTVRLLNTGLGFKLFWLSWPVNRLRDTIVYLSRNSSKLKLKEEEIVGKVERSMKEILFRTAALVAVAGFRFS